MFKPSQDQAAGLRRIMAKPVPRIITVIAANEKQDLTKWMVNLAATFAQQTQQALLLDASGKNTERVYGQALPVSLTEVVKQERTLSQAVLNTAHGYDVARLTQYKALSPALSPNLIHELEAIVVQMAHQYDVLLVEAKLNEDEHLTLPKLNQYEMVVQMTASDESLKQAYTCIKRIYQQQGKRDIGMMVTQCGEATAQKAFERISQVARQFLGIELHYLGSVPEDEQLSKAYQLGKTVLEAFPLAMASQAFKQLASSMEKTILNMSQKAA